MSTKHFLLSVLLLVFICLVATSASALTWSSPVEIGWGAEWDMYPDAAADREGHIHVVFQTYPFYRNLMYNYFDGNHWTGAYRIGQGTEGAWGPSITTDFNGLPHVVWSAYWVGGRGSTFYTHFDGASWSAPVDIGMPQGFYSIAVDSTGQVFIAGVRYDQIYVVHGGQTGWSTPVIAAVTTCVYPGLSVDSSGTVYLSYCDQNYGAAFKVWDGSQWSDATELTGYCGGDWTKPYLFHSDAGASDFVCAGSTLRHWHRAPGSSEWQGPIEVASATNDVAGSASGYLLAVSDVLEPQPSDVYARIWTGSEWSAAENVSDTTWKSQWSAAVITSNNDAVVVWSENVGHAWPWMLTARSAPIRFNAAPSAIVANQPYSLPEGSAIQLVGEATDPDGDPLTFAWDLDGDGIFETPGQTTTFSAADYDGPSDQVVTLQVCDDAAACGTASATVQITNAPPMVDAGPNQTVYSGDPLLLAALFTDPGIQDTHSASADFGTGAGPAPAVVVESAGSGTVTGQQSYLTSGLYVVEVCVSDDDGGTGCDSLSVEVLPLPVTIDIKPGSDPNSINCTNKNGVIAVAILSTDGFDSTTVDHTKVTFAGASETHIDKKSREPRRHEEDVDGDGDPDLVFHFRLGDTSLTCNSTEGTLMGQTLEGIHIKGTDSVRMVKSTEIVSSVATDGCFEEAHPEWTVKGSWSPIFGDEASGGQLISYSSSKPKKNDYLEFTFAAEGFGLVYHKGPYGGITDVFIDNIKTPYTQLDMYAETDQWLDDAVLEVSGLDPDTAHVLRVVPTGKKNPLSGGYVIDLDRIDLPAYDSYYNDNCLFSPNSDD